MRVQVKREDVCDGAAHEDEVLPFEARPLHLCVEANGKAGAARDPTEKETELDRVW